MKHFCHHCGIHSQTRLNFFKLLALKRVYHQNAFGNEKGKLRGKQAKEENGGPLIDDVIEMINSLSSCLASFTPRFEHHVSSTPPIKVLNHNTHTVCVKKGTHA